MKRLIAMVTMMLAVTCSNAQVIQSPNGALQLTFEVKDSMALYSLNFNNQPVLLKSKLGMEIANGFSFKEGFGIKDFKINKKDESWQPVLGEVKQIRNQYTELVVYLAQPAYQREMAIHFRLFNDGLGLRYEFPEQANLNYFVVKEEATEFALPGDAKAWWIPGDYDTQEYNYTTSKLSEVPQLFDKSYDGNASQTIAPGTLQTPLMMKTDNGFYLNFHEAALIDYPALHLSLDADKLILRSHLTPDAQGNKGYIQTPFQTPWRTIIVSKKAEGILASKLVLNLNEPAKYESTEWIKPVKYVGVWWEMIIGKSTWNYANINNVHLGKTDYSKLQTNGTHAANTNYVKKYIDFAAKHGLDGVLIEGWNEGWEDWFGKSKEYVFDFVTPYPDFDVKTLADYARAKNVQLIMHHETSSAATNYERHFDTAFAFMDRYGYKAVKTGYVGNIIPRGEHHYSQWMVQHYQRVIDKALQHKVMVNSHESVHLTGLNRTYPNWIAAEAARGTEYEAFGGNKPEHTTILPFTRLIGGPMDYTPGIFQTRLDYYFPGDKRFVQTTLVKQLALYVTMYSPLQMAADMIDNYERFPDAFQFIKDVAVDWDETRILSAEPGDHVLIARKTKGKDEWFVGGITDEQARTLSIDFSFLPAGANYEAIIYEDGKDADYINNPQAYHIYKKIVNSKTKLSVKLARSGGVAISIKKR